MQYYGWGYLNRAQLLPTREQVNEAIQHHRSPKKAPRRPPGNTLRAARLLRRSPQALHERLGPALSHRESRPVKVLPCPTASGIPGLHFDNVREHLIAWIWNDSESFNRFRGIDWMPEFRAKSCPQREIDFGGCRCQAALLTGDPNATDPVCTLVSQPQNH